METPPQPPPPSHRDAALAGLTESWRRLASTVDTQTGDWRAELDDIWATIDRLGESLTTHGHAEWHNHQCDGPTVNITDDVGKWWRRGETI